MPIQVAVYAARRPPAEGFRAVHPAVQEWFEQHDAHGDRTDA